MNDNLPELRDIHLPSEPIPFLPLAYGWWLLSALLIGIIAAIWLFRLWRCKSKRHYALKLLSDLDVRQTVSVIKMSELLRRICVYKYPRAATLFGIDWINFLNDHCRIKMGDSASAILLNAPYAAPHTSIFEGKDIAELREFCQAWIGENL